MSAESPAIVARSPKARSRVTNGGDWLSNVDQRSAIARRYRDIVAQISADCGGVDRLSETKLQLIRRFASGAVMAEAMESRLANGEEIDVAEHGQLSSTLVRLAARIGLSKVPHTVESLSDYMARKYPKQGAAS